jgi:hypothetical protein
MTHSHAPSTRPRRVVRSTILVAALAGVTATAMTSSTSIAAPGVGQAVGASLTDATATPPGVFIGVSPIRILDTRGPVAGGPIGVPQPGKLAANTTLNLLVAGTNRAVPANASSVLINVTIDEDASLASYLTVWPSGEPQPFTSANNALPGLIASNTILAKLGSTGGISIYNQRGDVNVVIDLIGYTVPVASIDFPGGQLQSGSGAPSDTVGNDGDFYVDTVNHTLYGPKANGTWPKPGFGIDGDDGDDAVNGTTGSNGILGGLSTFDDTPPVLAGNGAISFDSANDVVVTPAPSITHEAGDYTDIELTTGTYRVSYRVALTVGALGTGSVQLYLDDASQGSTNTLLTQPVAAPGTQATDTLLVKVTEPTAVLQLRLTGALNVTVDSSSIEIEKVANS